jgi:hypothetical protein
MVAIVRGLCCGGGSRAAPAVRGRGRRELARRGERLLLLLLLDAGGGMSVLLPLLLLLVVAVLEVRVVDVDVDEDVVAVLLLLAVRVGFAVVVVTGWVACSLSALGACLLRIAAGRMGGLTGRLAASVGVGSERFCCLDIGLG